MEHHNECSNHVCKCTSSTCKQTLEDMDFERGIWYAGQYGLFDLYRLLISKYSLAIIAAQYGDYERVKKLLGRGVDVVDNAGYTALHYAARAGHTKVCELLINFGASLDAQTRAGLATPLHRAANAGDYIC